MTSIMLTVAGAQVWATVTGTLTSGMVGIPVTIKYDEAWDGLTKNLVCRCSRRESDPGEQRAILNVEEAAAVAHEVMKPGMQLYLGIEGYRSDGKLVIPTTWAACGEIKCGANTGADITAEPTLPVWNQLQTEIEQIRQETVTQEQTVELLASAQSAVQAAEKAAQSEERAGISEANAESLANEALRYQQAAEAAAARAENAAGSSSDGGYTLPIGGDELGGVKNGGNVTINADGTMTAPEAEVTDEQVGNAVGKYWEEHPELATNVADRSITAQKTTFITPEADNKIDMSKCTLGVQGSTGAKPGDALQNTNLGCTTDYIAVTPGKTYVLSKSPALSTGLWASHGYNADYESVWIIDSNPFTVPDGVAYVRISYMDALSDTMILGMYEGTLPQVYTQGVQRYELDELLEAAVVRTAQSIPVPLRIGKRNLFVNAGVGTVTASTGKISVATSTTATGNTLSGLIPVIPGVSYVSNGMPNDSNAICLNANKEFAGALADVSEITGSYAQGNGTFGSWRRFTIINQDVCYLVFSTPASIPAETLYVMEGTTDPATLEGDVITADDPAYIEMVKEKLWDSGDSLRGLTWAVLGDSITSGEGKKRTYHSITAAKLGLNAINYGVAGSCIAGGMSTSYAQMDAEAGIITVFGGINDIRNNVTVGTMGDTTDATFYGALDVLVKGLLLKYPGKRIGFITPLNYGDDAQAQPYLDAIFAVCRKYAVPVLDLYHEGVISTATEELSTMYFSDGLHPNEAGHDVLARKVEAWLRTL